MLAQDTYTMTSYAFMNQEHRIRKARTVLAIIGQHIVPAEAKVLEAGTGSGFMSAFFADNFGSLDSVDVVDERQVREGYRFHQVDTAHMPFEDNSFDVVISNQVIEHIEDQRLHLAEAFRVLRPGGFLYVATPNRYWPREVHSSIFFLGYLPQHMAAKVFEKKRGKAWDVYPLSYGQLTKLLRAHTDTVTNYAPRIIQAPEQFHYVANQKDRSLQRAVNRLPESVLSLLTHIMPSFFLVAQKPPGAGLSD